MSAVLGDRSNETDNCILARVLSGRCSGRFPGEASDDALDVRADEVGHTANQRPEEAGVRVDWCRRALRDGTILKDVALSLFVGLGSAPDACE